MLLPVSYVAKLLKLSPSRLYYMLRVDKQHPKGPIKKKETAKQRSMSISRR